MHTEHDDGLTEYVVGRAIKKGQVVQISESGIIYPAADNVIPLVRAEQDLPIGTKVVIDGRRLLVRLEEGKDAGATDWAKGLVG